MHHESRKYEFVCMRKPYAMIFATSSNVKMARYRFSHFCIQRESREQPWVSSRRTGADCARRLATGVLRGSVEAYGYEVRFVGARRVERRVPRHCHNIGHDRGRYSWLEGFRLHYLDHEVAGEVVRLQDEQRGAVVDPPARPLDGLRGRPHREAFQSWKRPILAGAGLAGGLTAAVLGDRLGAVATCCRTRSTAQPGRMRLLQALLRGSRALVRHHSSLLVLRKGQTRSAASGWLETPHSFPSTRAQNSWVVTELPANVEQGARIDYRMADTEPHDIQSACAPALDVEKTEDIQPDPEFRRAGSRVSGRFRGGGSARA